MAFSVFSIAVKLAVAFAFSAYKLVSLIRFYIHARRTGFPVYISPVMPKSILWLVLAPPLVPQLEKYLPGWIYDRLDVVTHGWEYRRKRGLDDRLGNPFGSFNLGSGCHGIQALTMDRRVWRAHHPGQGNVPTVVKRAAYLPRYKNGAGGICRDDGYSVPVRAVRATVDCWAG